MKNYLVLVNAEHPLFHPVDPSELVCALDGYPGILLERTAAKALRKLLADIGSRDEIVPVSGWRSREEQKKIWKDTVAERGIDFARKYVALPACSEHETGLAIDLALNQEPVDFIRPHFPKDGICRLFREKMIAYGFIERYPEGKESITGIASEPWHFRYVGLPHAAIMKQHGFCLEEYIDYLSLFPAEGRHLEINIQNKNFEIFYQKISDSDSSVTLSLPSSLPFQVSGTNTDGCIVTLWR